MISDCTAHLYPAEVVPLLDFLAGVELNITMVHYFVILNIYSCGLYNYISNLLELSKVVTFSKDIRYCFGIVGNYFILHCSNHFISETLSAYIFLVAVE